MRERERLLEKLVSRWHVDVAERHASGRVQPAEVAATARSLFLSWKRFPKYAREADTSSMEPIYEGEAMTYLASGQVRITWQRPLANDPSQLAQIRRRVYPTVELAVDAFISSEWPRGIDGIAGIRLTGGVPRNSCSAQSIAYAHCSRESQNRGSDTSGCKSLA